MELKKYQKKVISDLRSYLDHLGKTESLAEAYENFWQERQVGLGINGVDHYQNIIEGVPHVCYKVPTGGGKTLLACASLRPIFAAMNPNRHKAVVWLVPSDSILTQTLAALKDPTHPYRQKINADFGGRVEVYSKVELLTGQNFSPSAVLDQLSVMVLSYDSFRSSRKEGRKAYQPNGALEPFRGKLPQSIRPIKDTDDSALFQVINHLNPVVVVDESHHARSTLSVEMLNNFNPCFVLDLTATPSKKSNIISYVDALALKAEDMVKLPVVVYNRNSQAEVIADAIDLRKALENSAAIEEQKGGPYIRPIVLFQAQPKNKEDSTSFEKLKAKLVASGIPREQIAIKTASVDELKDVNLLSPDCPIRFIITVNALKEGWDCPFAYVLASLANRNSRVDVEQILGRILRQPYVRQHADALLNMSFVLASSANFQQAVDDVITGLNAAGFSGRDYRIAEVASSLGASLEEETGLDAEKEQTSSFETENRDGEPEEEFLEFSPEDVASETQSSSKVTTPRDSISSMVKEASQLSAQYKRESENEMTPKWEEALPLDLKDKVNRFYIVDRYREHAKNLRLPQFHIKERQLQVQLSLEGDSLFSTYEESCWKLLEPENLNRGFNLKGKDSTIDISQALEDMVTLDVRAGHPDRPQIFDVDQRSQQIILNYLESLPAEARVRQARETILSSLDRKFDSVDHKQLRSYVSRIVENLDSQQLKLLETSPLLVVPQIQRKIATFLTEHRFAQFQEKVDLGEIQTKAEYELPPSIHPVKASTKFSGSLYEAEGDMNLLEQKFITKIAALDNILWWHRINDRARGAFRINGPFNHYPDFLVATKSGKIIVVETKGAMLKNDDSRDKLKFGRLWASLAGPDFSYWMVFDNDAEPIEDAYTVAKALSLARQL